MCIVRTDRVTEKLLGQVCLLYGDGCMSEPSEASARLEYGSALVGPARPMFSGWVLGRSGGIGPALVVLHSADTYAMGRRLLKLGYSNVICRRRQSSEVDRDCSTLYLLADDGVVWQHANADSSSPIAIDLEALAEQGTARVSCDRTDFDSIANLRVKHAAGIDQGAITSTLPDPVCISNMDACFHAAHVWSYVRDEHRFVFYATPHVLPFTLAIVARQLEKVPGRLILLYDAWACVCVQELVSQILRYVGLASVECVTTDLRTLQWYLVGQPQTLLLLYQPRALATDTAECLANLIGCCPALHILVVSDKPCRHSTQYTQVMQHLAE
jgi:hypothetical protein